MTRPGSTASPWREAAGTLLVGAWLLGLAPAGVAATYGPSDLLLLVPVYLALATALLQGALLLRELPAGGLLGGALLALALVWQLRELTRVPASILLTVLVAAAFAGPVWFLLLRPAGAGSRRRRLLLIGAAAGTATLVTLGGAAASETFRWHLLRHNTLLGTPFYYLVEPSVETVRERWLERLPAVPPPTALPAASSSPGEAVRPHLVFVLLDTLRADALGGWGGDPDLMPELGRRLETAFRLTDVQANASWTRPSMASYFTGLLPEEHGAIGVEDALAEGYETLAESLAARGYETVAFTTNIAASGRGAGFAQGFETFVELTGAPYARAERVGRAVDAWLRERGEAGRPVFLYLHFLDPHEPYLAGDAPGRERPAAYRRAYRRELAYLDRELESTLARIETGLAGPEVLVVASDHGEEFFEHELFGHGQSLYDEVLHVPVAIRTPHGPGGTVAAPLEGRDLHRLLLELADDPRLDPAGWAVANARPRRYASLDYSTTGRLALRPYLARVVMRALREGDEKLVWSAYGDTRELYDLAEDPGETRNLLRERPERAAALARDLEEIVTARVERSPVAPSEAEREQLRALGYVD